jgi:hypothetical protein
MKVICGECVGSNAAVNYPAGVRRDIADLAIAGTLRHRD